MPELSGDSNSHRKEQRNSAQQFISKRVMNNRCIRWKKLDSFASRSDAMLISDEATQPVVAGLPSEFCYLQS
ncbi:hypothetical protein KOR42_28430 [Thalassoglobus neptunius]|uniref:Uncharacterized protein n=1 Tax=Thalassoglobus neptunius TaxID=1938619 RepID=A0A5C5WXS0_9PLAN|nr:hypothetical protein KOR42_28430 [Thalassoglobus neptunius]